MHLSQTYLQVKSLAFGKRLHSLYSSYWYRCLRTSWIVFFYAFFAKQVLKVFDFLKIHICPHGEFHFHCSDFCGSSLPCLFLLHSVPGLKFEAEASAEVGLCKKKQEKFIWLKKKLIFENNQNTFSSILFLDFTHDTKNKEERKRK